MKSRELNTVKLGVCEISGGDVKRDPVMWTGGREGERGKARNGPKVH